MTGNQETRLRNLIAGAKLDQAIDAELEQWKNAKSRLHEVGEALIAVSTPVSDNLGAETVKSALTAFKQVGDKVNERAEDIDKIYTALDSAVTATRTAQTVVSDMDGDQRQKPEFPPSKPGDDETDENHDLKVYSGQMNVYTTWSTAREAKAQEHAEKVEKAWLEAIAVMQQIPDDQKAGTDGTDGTTGPVVPTTPVTPTTPTTPTVMTDSHWEPPDLPDSHDPPDDPGWPDPPDDPPPSVPPTPHYPTPIPGTPGGHETPTHLDPYPSTPYGPSGTTVPTGVVAPTPTVGPGSLSGYAVGGAVGAGALGGLTAGLRAAGLAGAAGGLRGGGILGATNRAVGSARGSLGSRAGMAGGAATGGTGRGGSRGSAGRRGAGVGGAGAGRGKDKDKKKWKPASVELFDEDRDWIDDEGASPGVID